MFFLLSDADRFMALGSFLVLSKISKYLACIGPLKEILVKRPFQTCHLRYERLGAYGE